MNDYYEQKSVRVTVIYVDGKWEYFYGGYVPVRDGTVDDLLLDESAITEKGFVKKINRRSRHKILDQGSEIMVALTIKNKSDIDESLRKHLITKSLVELQLAVPRYPVRLSPHTQFVKVTVGEPAQKQMDIDEDESGGVWLDVQGLQPRGVISSLINLPDCVSSEPATSLNHAFTLLSIKYEPWRKSHTGNIYARIFYKEKNKKWYPLEILRNAAIVKDENLLIRQQWIDIAGKLNLHTP